MNKWEKSKIQNAARFDPAIYGFPDPENNHCVEKATDVAVGGSKLGWFDFAKIGKSINRRIKSIETD